MQSQVHSLSIFKIRYEEKSSALSCFIFRRLYCFAAYSDLFRVKMSAELKNPPFEVKALIHHVLHRHNVYQL